MAKEIKLTLGYKAIIDDDDYARLGHLGWYANEYKRKDGSVKVVYAVLCSGKFRLHRVILGIKDPYIEVDHRDGNGLNCQRNNLRVTNRAGNRQNSQKRLGCTSEYKGVSKLAGRDGWMSCIKVDGSSINLGSFGTQIEAAKAYNDAAIRYFGEFARLNYI